MFRAQELCENRGARPGLPVPNSPYGLCGRKATLNDEPTLLASLSGTFLQRKDVVNQCLEFDANHVYAITDTDDGHKVAALMVIFATFNHRFLTYKTNALSKKIIN